MPGLRTLALATLAGITLPIAATDAADAFAFSVNQSTSSITYAFNASAPFTGTMQGENDLTKPPAEQTRTKRPPQSLFSCGSLTATQNDLVNISGTIAASGSSSPSSPVRPAGTFKLGLNTSNNTCVLQDTNLNLIASGALGIAATINNFSTQAFCAINPSCNVPIPITINLPLGSVNITSITASQAAGNQASGTLTPAGPDAWTFTVPVVLTVTPTATFSGAPFPVAPQDVPTVLTGTVTRTGNTASIAATTQIDFAPTPITTPTPQPPFPFTLPSDSILCPNVNLVMTLTITSSTVTNSQTAALNADGTRIVCRCDSDASGSITPNDIFDFLNKWFTNDPAADFNGGGLAPSDIFDFLNCWFTPPLGC